MMDGKAKVFSEYAMALLKEAVMEPFVTRDELKRIALEADCTVVRYFLKECGLAFFNLDSAASWLQAEVGHLMETRRLRDALASVWWTESLRRHDRHRNKRCRRHKMLDVL